MTLEQLARADRRARRLNGIERGAVEESRPWPERLVRNPLTWVSLAAVPFYSLCLVLTFWAVVSAKKAADLHQARLLSMLGKTTLLALPTLVIWTLVFLLVDRWRAKGIALWFLALGWGGCAAVLVSLHLNTLVGALMGGEGAVAVYSAPFVEESAKATVLFLLALGVRNRLVGRLSMISLAGLSAVGFAVTEDIVYYLRAMHFALQNQNTGDAMAAVHKLVGLRGYLLSWGHPTFTAFTAIGLAFGLRSRSKSVRVVAPLAGFLAAAMGHMFFNLSASNEEALRIMVVSGAVLVLSWAATCLVDWLAHGRLIRARLADYAQAGWLRPQDPATFGRLANRIRLLWLAMFAGPRCFARTHRLIGAATDLAYLRDAMTRGLVDEAGLAREKELLFRIRDLRATAMDDPRAKHRRVLGRARLVLPPAPQYPGASGIAGHWPAPGGQQIASEGHTIQTPVNPQWAPPAG